MPACCVSYAALPRSVGGGMPCSALVRGHTGCGLCGMRESVALVTILVCGRAGDIDFGTVGANQHINITKLPYEQQPAHTQAHTRRLWRTAKRQ